MDAIKNLAGDAKKMSGGSGSGSSTGGASGGQDYVDKGLSAVEKKTGMPANSAINEKVTDQGREMYEKETGKDVSSKISN